MALEELVDQAHINYVLSAKTVSICCKLSELEDELAKIESEELVIDNKAEKQ